MIKIEFPELIIIIVRRRSMQVYTKVSAEYARKLAAGEIPQSTIPRTPTVEAAYEYHKATIAASGLSVGEYIKQSVLKDADVVIEFSPFPYVCDIGIDHYLYWMRNGYEPIEKARRWISHELDLEPDKIHIIRNTAQSVPEVPHYQVFVESINSDTLAPCYELSGQTRTLEEYTKDWETVLGYPVKVLFSSRGLVKWQPEDNIVKHGGTVRTFGITRA